ncbi:DNA-binding PadR family transcriptional regulator [Agromyces terreus]|uniref:DNA-binding PadR family transcriptional regulator n=1 Tax=Agromyces terreus TaxID=424795 RepID=A0A9X2GX12_9MICO|nr:PadR family transcriptional regulator [Agromyces terreus]MCP2370650.1 DNA-binding PadR family transcriptional regulator [Agromyces terreus]
MPRLNPLAVAALAVLVEQPMHPYEMYQLMLQRREDHVVRVSAGSLYRAVERLAADGLIVEHATEREGNRPERTVYAITEQGRAAFLETIASMLPDHVNEYPEFPLAVGEAHNLPRDRVVELLGERAEQLRATVASLDAGLARVDAKGVPTRFVLNKHYSRAMVLAELDWVLATIDDLTTGALDWSSPHGPHPVA